MGKSPIQTFFCHTLTLSLLVLHPAHKLDYFQAAGWEPEWINTAHQLVHDTFCLSYTACNTQQTEVSVSDQSDESEVSLEYYLILC